jgi:hypothetical protein
MAPAEMSRQFLDKGWFRISLPEPSPVHEVRKLLLDRLQARWIPELRRIEDYHLFVDDDARHIEIQNDLAELYWSAAAGPRIIGQNREFLVQLIGPDLHVSKFPYLRIARPLKSQDNVGYHRDTYYGSSPFEISVHVPFVDLDAAATLGVISGSHVEPESAFTFQQRTSDTVSKGSVKHRLGFLYAPKVMESTVASRMEPVPVRVGEALVFSLSIVHGQEVNRSHITRFSSDVRVVNSGAIGPPGLLHAPVLVGRDRAGAAIPGRQRGGAERGCPLRPRGARFAPPPRPPRSKAFSPCSGSLRTACRSDRVAASRCARPAAPFRKRPTLGGSRTSARSTEGMRFTTSRAGWSNRSSMRQPDSRGAGVRCWPRG